MIQLIFTTCVKCHEAGKLFYRQKHMSLLNESSIYFYTKLEHCGVLDSWTRHTWPVFFFFFSCFNSTSSVVPFTLRDYVGVTLWKTKSKKSIYWVLSSWLSHWLALVKNLLLLACIHLPPLTLFLYKSYF